MPDKYSSYPDFPAMLAPLRRASRWMRRTRNFVLLKDVAGLACTAS